MHAEISMDRYVYHSFISNASVAQLHIANKYEKKEKKKSVAWLHQPALTYHILAFPNTSRCLLNDQSETNELEK